MTFNEFLEGIANAIRNKKGTTDPIKPIDFASEIESIEVGGGSSDLVKYVTFMSEDGTTELFKMPVLNGDTCKDPIEHGDIETPTKESTAQYHYSYKGWSSSLNNVTEDKTVYAVYNSTVRSYKQYFYSDGVLVETLTVKYGETPTPGEPFIENYDFIGWEPALAPVVGETTYHAQFEYNDGYIKDSWSVIAQNGDNGTYAQTYEIGNKKQHQVSYNGTTYVLDFELIAFDHDNLSDNSGKAHMTWLAKQAIPIKYSIYNQSGYLWKSNSIRTTLQKTFTNLDDELKSVIKTVKKSDGYKNSKPSRTVDDNMWIPSTEEMNSMLDSINSGLVNDYDEPYAIFSDNNSRIRVNVNTDEVMNWILRTTGSASTGSDYCSIGTVNENGYVMGSNYNSNNGTRDVGVVIGFCI